MLIRLGYDIHFQVAASVPMIAHLNVHPSRTLDLVGPDHLRTEPAIEIEQYQDSFGNLAADVTDERSLLA
jgi:hypothetical protein